MTDRIKHKSGEPDGSSAIAHELDTYDALVNASAKLLSIKNQGDEKLSVDKDGKISGPNFPYQIVLPSEGDAGIEAAIQTVSAAGGGIVQLLEGTYVVDTGINPGNTVENVILQGVGPGTIIEHDGILSGPSMTIEGQRVQYFTAIDDITSGDTSITYTTVTEAGNVLEGDILFIKGTDGDTLTDREAQEAAADGNPSTGQVLLKGTIVKDMTGVTCQSHRGGRNIKVRDMKFTAVAPTAGAHAVYLKYTTDCVVENVDCVGIGGSNASGAIDIEYQGVRNVVRNCRGYDLEYGLIGLRYNIGARIMNCEAVNVNLGNLGTGTAAIALQYGTTDTIIQGNKIDTGGRYGITIANITSNLSRRISVIGNQIRNVDTGMSIGGHDIQVENNAFHQTINHGIRIQSTYDCIVKGNTFRDTGSTSIYLWHNEQLVIDGNHVKNSQKAGISHESGDIINCTITNNVIDGTGLDDSSGFGMYLGFGAGSTGCIIANNIIKNCIVTNWTGRGLMITQGSGYTICNNFIYNTSGTGMNLGITDSIVIGNNANGEGISVSGAGTTVALNKS